jgi:hypothetical protein
MVSEKGYLMVQLPLLEQSATSGSRTLASSMEGSMADRRGHVEWRVLGNMKKATASSACRSL